MAGKARPYRATVYLPGVLEDDDGNRSLVVVAKVTAASEEGLDRALKRWEADGYAIARHEVLYLF